MLSSVRRTGGGSVEELVRAVYDDVDPIMHPVAKRSLLAHLEKLVQDGVATVSAEGRYAPIG